MEAWGYAGALVMGVILGLIGGGGSILSVPLLVYCFGIPGAAATYHSLVIVGAAALAGVIPYARKRQVDVATGLTFFAPALAGVLLSRRIILPGIPEEMTVLGMALTKDTLILSTFAVVMLLAAISMIRGRAPARVSGPPRRFAALLSGGVIGCVTGFVGAGGGFLIVPTLVIGLQLPMERAVGTSLLIIGLNSLSGFLGDWLSGLAVNWSLVVPLLVLALAGVGIGAWIGRFVPGAKLKVAFGWFVLIVGTWLLASQIYGA